MKEFKDANGIAWQISLNGHTMKQVRDIAEIDLWRVFEDEKTLTDLYVDPEKVIDIIYVLCDKQIKERDFSPEQFYEGWFGDCLGLATKTLFDEILDFAPNPKRRAAMQRALGKLDEMDEVASQYAMAEIEAIDIKAMMQQALSQPSGNSQE